MRLKILAVITLFSIFLCSSAAQPTDLPHRVYGDVSSDDVSVSGMNVSFRNSTDYVVVEDNVSSEGFYDVYLSGLDQGESAYLFLGGQNTSEYVNFSQGASEGLNCNLDTGSYTCVEDSGGEDDSEDQNNDNEDNQENNDDSDDGGSGGGSGGGGSGGFSGGGGFAPEPDEEPLNISAELVDGEADFSVGEVESGQVVEIQVSGSEYMQGFSFTAEESGNVSVALELFEEMPGNYGEIQGRILRYFQVDVQGIDSFSESALTYQVSDSWLLERNSGVEEVRASLSQGASWNGIENNLITDSLSSNSFEAVSDDRDGLFAFKVPQENDTQQEVESDGLDIQDLRVTPSESGDTAEVSAVAVNNRDEPVNDSLSLEVDGSSIETWEFSLDPGETREISYTADLGERGSYSLSLGGETTQIDTSRSDEQGGFPVILLVVGAGVLLLITALLAYIYLIEYRRASELDETIKGIEQSGERVDREMKNMRSNIEKIREHITGVEDDKGRR